MSGADCHFFLDASTEMPVLLAFLGHFFWIKVAQKHTKLTQVSNPISSSANIFFPVRGFPFRTFPFRRAVATLQPQHGRCFPAELLFVNDPFVLAEAFPAASVKVDCQCFSCFFSPPSFLKPGSPPEKAFSRRNAQPFGVGEVGVLSPKRISMEFGGVFSSFLQAPNALRQPSMN